MLGRRPDGYHLLDSLVAFADLGDCLTVGLGDGLSVTGPFAAGVPTGDDNLVRRALAAAGLSRAVRLEKALPHPAGLGGGSSDAAAVLRLSDATLSPEAALALGADVPVCLRARATRMRGIGEALSDAALPPLPAVLVNPGVPVSTARVFAGLAPGPRDDMGALPDGAADASGWIDWLRARRNDLEAPACALAPEIDGVLAALRATGSGLVRMSGSGASCVALYPDPAAAEDAARAVARPGWWVRACTLA